MTTQLEPVLISGREAAAMLGICERTLYTLSKGGAVARVKVGKRGVRYRKADIVRFGNEQSAFGDN
jgi:predicted DNA-binding transcriptional regulator AlpA